MLRLNCRHGHYLLSPLSAATLLWMTQRRQPGPPVPVEDDLSLGELWQ